MTLAGFAPCSVHLLRYPSMLSVVYAVVITSLSFFLFSFHVHEKTILLCVVPACLLAAVAMDADSPTGVPSGCRKPWLLSLLFLLSLPKDMWIHVHKTRSKVDVEQLLYRRHKPELPQEPSHIVIPLTIGGRQGATCCSPPPIPPPPFKFVLSSQICVQQAKKFLYKFGKLCRM